MLISGHDGGTGAIAAHLAEARRRTVGARPRRDPADAAAQRAARPHRGAGRRPVEDRPRRGDRRAARRRGVRLRHRAAGGERLRDDARLPPRHLPGGRGHAEPRAAQRSSAASPSSSSTSWSTSPRRCASRWRSSGFRTMAGDDRPRRGARHRAAVHALEGEGPRHPPDPRGAAEPVRPDAAPVGAARTTVSPRRSTSSCIAAVRAGHRAGEHVEHRAADPQREPHGRHDARPRDHHRATAAPACPTTPSTLQLPRLGRPELRCLRARRASR